MTEFLFVFFFSKNMFPTSYVFINILLFTLGTESIAINFAAAIITASLFVSSIYSLFTSSSSVSSVK